MQELTALEIKRYNRNIILPEVGAVGQQKLKKSKVLVIGAGGLGSPVLLYLAAAGVGTIGILDYDKVDESNLQRQVLYNNQDVGASKVLSAKTHLASLNPLITIQTFEEKLNNDNALDIINKFDLVVDGSDNFPTRYLINDACVILNKPWVFGSIYKFEGQVAVFNFNNGPSYRCLYPQPPLPGEIANCSEIGVIGVLPGIIGTIQANEVIKMILGIGEVLSAKLLVFDALSMNQFQIKFKKVASNFDIKSLTDYDLFCGTLPTQSMKGTIEPEELKSLLDKGEDIQLIDVREPWESELCMLNGAILIPLGQVTSRIEEVVKDKLVVVYCHHGFRSAQAIKLLSEQYGYQNLINLNHGIHGWSQTVDPEMDQY